MGPVRNGIDGNAKEVVRQFPTVLIVQPAMPVKHFMECIFTSLRSTFADALSRKPANDSLPNGRELKVPRSDSDDRKAPKVTHDRRDCIHFCINVRQEDFCCLMRMIIQEPRIHRLVI